MATIYYLLCIVFLLWELSCIKSPKKQHAKFLSATEKDKFKTDNDYIYLTFHLIYVIWIVIGLASFQYIIPLFILLIACIPSKKFVFIFW
jgi:hypothetical protein